MACLRLGYGRDELLGMGPLDIDAVDRHRELPGLVRELMATGRTTFETTHVSRHGERIPVEISAHLFPLEGRRVVLSIARDLRERDRLLDANRRLLLESVKERELMDATMESAADALLVYGTGGDIVRTNAAARRMLGTSVEGRDETTASGTAPLEVSSVEGKHVLPEAMPAVRALRGETVRGETLMVSQPDGRRVWLSASAAPIRSAGGRLLGAVASFTDITATEEMREQGEDFLKMVSHDLRTPLTIIQSYAQRLAWDLQQAEAPDSERRAARHILASARQMNRMIGDLVATVRAEAGKHRLQLQPVELTNFIPSLIERVSVTMDTARVTLALSPDIGRVTAEPDFLERVLVNLISNALKYSPPSSEVEISAYRHASEVVLSVRNQSTGVSPQEMTGLFQRFHRAAGSGGTEGLGLGLYTARRLVEAQGGRIWAESEPGGWNSFKFSLPAAETAGER